MHNRKSAWDGRSMRHEARKARNIAPFWVIGMASWAGVPLGSYLMLFHFGGTAFGVHELPWLVMYIGWLLFGGVILAGRYWRGFYLPPRLGVSNLTFLGRPLPTKGRVEQRHVTCCSPPFSLARGKITPSSTSLFLCYSAIVRLWI